MLKWSEKTGNLVQNMREIEIKPFPIKKSNFMDALYKTTRMSRHVVFVTKKALYNI